MRAAPPAGTRFRPARDAAPATLLFLIVAAVALRAPQIGNPLFDIDEQFYLLVGDRMLHGALPYVDIWDRKPIGLFLIYAAIRRIGGDGVIQYQIVASLCAIATAAVIAAIARRMTGAIGAAAGGLIYLVWLNLLGGGGGQSPVFYNLLTALAALATLSAIEFPEQVMRYGRAAMLASGLAIQVKTTALFEGCLFGLVLLHVAWRRDRDPVSLVAIAIQLIAVALLPTAAAFATYAWLGHAREFWFANFTSIFLRAAPPNAHPGVKLGGVVLVLLPLGLAALAGLAARWRDGASRFVALWLAVAAAGFLAVTPYYNHYALPLLVPLSIAAALAFGSGRVGLAAAGLMTAGMLWLAGWPSLGRTTAARERLAVLGGAVSSNLDGGCLFVFQGPPILYLATRACTVSRFVFPAHLNYLGEARAIGADPADETRRAIAARPAVIVTSRRAAIVDPNPETWPIVEAALARDYRLVGKARADYRMLGVYARKDR